MCVFVFSFLLFGHFKCWCFLSRLSLLFFCVVFLSVSVVSVFVLYVLLSVFLF